jgi:hypothetical protein
MTPKCGENCRVLPPLETNDLMNWRLKSSALVSRLWSFDDATTRTVQAQAHQESTEYATSQARLDKILSGFGLDRFTQGPKLSFCFQHGVYIP